jgi:hypothetical protein
MKLSQLALLAALAGASAAPVHASTVTLRFSGTADLSTFGASEASVFEGDVTWDTSMVPQWYGGWYARYLIDGEPGSVRATFSVDGIDYSDRVRAISRLEHLPYELFLEFHFEPILDLDNGPAQDVISAYLWLWSPAHEDAGEPVFPNVRHLPANLSFLSELERQRFAFRGSETSWYPGQVADTLTVPEPSVLAVLLAAACAAGWRRRSRP